MHNRNYIGLVYIFIFAAAAVQFYIAYHAVGGVDINVYWGQSIGIDYRNPRYYQEPVSWEIIRILSYFLDRGAFVFGFSVIVLAISIARLGFLGGVILYAAFLSPFGVMLEFNILRQCLGTLFIIFFILSIVKDRRIVAAIWGVLAILSHNSLILILGFLVFVYYYTVFGRDWKIISSVGLVFGAFLLQLFGGLELILGSRTEAFTSNVIDDGLQNVVYLVFALILCASLFLVAQQKKWRPIAVGLIAATLFTLIVTLLLGLDEWVYGRMAITAIVICHFLLLYDAWEMRRAGLFGALFLASIIVVNGTIILFHPGAMTMIQGYYL